MCMCMCVVACVFTGNLEQRNSDYCVVLICEQGRIFMIRSPRIVLAI